MAKASLGSVIRTNLTTGLVIDALSSVTSASLSPVSTTAAYASNYQTQVILPTPPSLVAAWYGGYLTHRQFAYNMGKHGIDIWPQTGPVSATDALWQQVINAGRPQFDPDEAAHYLNCGLIDQGKFSFLCWHGGFGEPTQQEIISITSDLPSMDTILRQHRLGQMSDREYAYWSDLHGFNEPRRRAIMERDRNVYGPHEVVSMAQRGLIGDDEVTQNLAADGYITMDMRRSVLGSMIDIPKWGDVLALIQRGQSGLAGLNTSRLLAERPANIQQLLMASGVAWSLGSAMPNVPGAADVTMADVAWANHWVLPSLANGAEWRAMSNAWLAGWRPVGIPQPGIYTDDDYRGLLRKHGYHPDMRDAIVATSYAQLGYRQLLYSATYENWTFDQIKQRVLLNNIAPDEVDGLARTLFRRSNEARWPWIRAIPNSVDRGWAALNVEGYAYGAINFAEAEQNLIDSNLDQATADRVLNTARKTNTLSRSVAVSKTLQEFVTRTTASQVESILAMFRANSISLPDATAALLPYGYTQQEITSLLESIQKAWIARQATLIAERNQHYAAEATSKLSSATEAQLRAGIIDPSVAVSVLSAAGLPLPAVQAHVSALEAEIAASWSNKIEASIQKEFLSGNLSQIDAVNYMQRAGLTLLSAQQRVNAWLAETVGTHRFATASQVLGFVADGLMPQAVARSRLLQLGYSAPDAQLFLANAQARLTRMQSAQQAFAAQSRKAQIAEAQRTLKQAQSLVVSLQKRVKSLVPLSTVKLWLNKGTIDLLYAVNWFAASGYPPAAAQKYLENWGKWPSGTTLNYSDFPAERGGPEDYGQPGTVEPLQGQTTAGAGQTGSGTPASQP